VTLYPKPKSFSPQLAPPGVELRLEAYRTSSNGTWWMTRPPITPRLQLVHTNGATGEGSIESAINWGNGGPYTETHPHYQVDRNRAAKLVPTDRRGIGNATQPSAQGTHGNVTDWSIVIETADPGYPTPGEDEGFVGTQAETVATILAYESIVWGIPLEYPTEWFGAGTACHTEPFGDPYWTLFPGKVCPGRTKKAQMRNVVLPRAREIAAAWMGDPQPEGDEVTYLAKVHADDSAALCVSGHVVSWVPNGAVLAAVEQIATNDRNTMVVLTADQRAGLIWVGQQPFYSKSSIAGDMRCRADLFGAQG